MRISPINNKFYEQKNSFARKNVEQNQAVTPSFKAFMREVRAFGSNKILWKNNTATFRIDLPWADLLEQLVKKYENSEKVSVFVYASSIGLECYSFLMELISNYDQSTVNKFTPIIAKDIDPFVIEMAKRKLIEINDVEKDRINIHTNNRFDDFFVKSSKIDGKYKPKPILTDKIIFDVGDFTEEYTEIPTNKVIVFARNCWPYFSDDAKEHLPKRLYNHFEKEAVLITGNFDSLKLGYDKFKDSGFKSTSIPYVYEK